ncbi:MAG: CDP-alcohol phosphatidyltransferase family protein [Phyllobacteriaceae bacterium]|jgi:cardiolipin synthase|nr:CDP-alcohol phosphatidyltransferase family protein [Phyllobacteriaceae bacterium]
MPVSLPNLITIGRILIVPLTVWLIIGHEFALAFLAFLVAGVSDGIDGYIARRYDLQSELGGYLDPIADKALLVSIFVALASLQLLPAWLAILVVTRDILIVGAVLLAWIMDRPMAMKPVLVSKVNTVAQIAFAGALLLVLATGMQLSALLTAGTVLVAALTTASGGVYLRDWVRHMNGHKEKGEQP